MPSISVQYPSSMLYIITFRDINRICFCLYRYGLNSRQFYNSKDRTLNGKDGNGNGKDVAVTVKKKIGK